MQELGRFEDMEVDKEQARERVKEMERTLRTVNVAIQVCLQEYTYVCMYV